MSNDISSDAKKLIPAEPDSSQVIRQVTPLITTVSAPFARFGLFKVGSRATIVKLENGSLAVFSPVALTPAVRQEMERMGGQVQYLVAPDSEHHIFLTQWSKAFPRAHVIGMEGLPEKRAKDPTHAGVAFSHVFSAKEREVRIDDAFHSEFDIEFVPGHGNKELVANHRPSRTLIQADLLFNLPAYEQYSKTPGGSAECTHGIPSRIFNALLHTRGGNKMHRRFLWYGGIIEDKKSFGDSVKKIYSWDWDRIIPCHGDVIETDGKKVFSGIMEWYLDNKKTN